MYTLEEGEIETIQKYINKYLNKRTPFKRNITNNPNSDLIQIKILRTENDIDVILFKIFFKSILNS